MLAMTGCRNGQAASVPSGGALPHNSRMACTSAEIGFHSAGLFSVAGFSRTG